MNPDRAYGWLIALLVAAALLFFVLYLARLAGLR